MTRRELGNLLIACASARPVLGAGVLPIDELNLPPELYAELRGAAQSILNQARWLEELPLDDVPPGFVFTPR